MYVCLCSVLIRYAPLRATCGSLSRCARLCFPSGYWGELGIQELLGGLELGLLIGIFGVVLQFGGILLGEVEFLGDYGFGFPVAPLGVAHVLRSDTVAHGLGLLVGFAIIISRSRVLGEGSWFDNGGGISQHWHEAAAIQAVGFGEIAKFDQRGEEVH